MNISEAAKKAVEVNGYIYRANWKGIMQIRPTNEPECCFVYTIHQKYPTPRWNPQAMDLEADDWEITTESLFQIFQYDRREYFKERDGKKT